MIAFMDVYTISRLFRKYKSSNTRNSNESQYSFIVTGDAHTENYIKMLTDLGFKTIETYTSNNYWNNRNLGLTQTDNDCIKYKITQPLFSIYN